MFFFVLFQGGDFADAPIHVKYDRFLVQLDKMSSGKWDGPFTIVVNDPLSNSFIGPVPAAAIELALTAEKDGNGDCYENFVDPALKIVEYTRSDAQNENLGLNDIKVEGYGEEGDGGGADYGTDKPAALSDRLENPHVRGPDHPFDVAKAPVEGDHTAMGPGTLVMGGARLRRAGKEDREDAGDIIVRERELGDWEFEASEGWKGAREGKAFKKGAKGLGYYATAAAAGEKGEEKNGEKGKDAAE